MNLNQRHINLQRRFISNGKKRLSVGGNYHHLTVKQFKVVLKN